MGNALEMSIVNVLLKIKAFYIISLSLSRCNITIEGLKLNKNY
jgi:hypothetical protein